MQVTTKDGDFHIIEALRNVKRENGSHFGIYFNLSKLHEGSYSSYQEKIVINILNDYFKNNEGVIIALSNKDIAIIYHGGDKNVIDRVIFQIRNLFADDIFTVKTDGTDNEQFCKVFIINYQWQDFYDLCNQKKEPIEETTNKPSADFPTKLEKHFKDINILSSIRTQSICAIPAHNKDSISCVFQELYVSIAILKETLKYDVSFFSNKNLFRYFTEKLDLEILKILRPKIELQPHAAISLNLNVTTILTDQFAEFTKAISKIHKLGLVIEIDIADVFSDINAYITAKQYLQSMGHRICLDGLNNLSFLQVDRESLGFDLAKLQWNADNARALSQAENIKLVESIKKYGANRVILCRCDNQNAILYGQALGISLFQGWHLDKTIDKNLVPKIIL